MRSSTGYGHRIGSPLKNTVVAIPALLLASALASPALATNTLHVPMGQDLSYGGVSHPHTVQSTSNNPAAATAASRRGIWLGLGGISLGYEVGAVDNLIERAEDLEAALDRDRISFQEAEDLKAEFDDFLTDVGQDGTFKIAGAAKVPFTPIGATFDRLGGAVSFDATLHGTIGGRILDAPILVVPLGGGDYELQSLTSGYLKGAYGVQLSLGYGRGVFENDSGALFVGSRLHYYDMELAKTVIALEQSGDGDFSDELEDDLDRNTRSSSAVGLDVGALWVTRHYTLGGTLRNLNEPEFDYPELGSNCNDPALSATASTNCFTAAAFGDRISLNETYTMARQLQLEAALYTLSRNWFVGASLDVNSSRDPIGDEYQWATLSGGYTSKSWLIPGFRLGLRSNRAGSELTYYTGGLTLFRVLQLDAAVSTDSVKVDGDSMPRSALFSASLELSF